MEPPGPNPANREYGGDAPRPFRRGDRRPLLDRFVPLVPALREYRREWIGRDVLAGVVIAALAVPQSMAYAQTAGLPVQAGLYALLVPVVAYAALGSSRRLMTGPTAAAALLVPAAVLPIASAGSSAYLAAAAMLALLVGALLALGRLLRLGWITDYISVAVLLGFLTGMALTLITGQLGAFFGVSVTSGSPVRQVIDFSDKAADGVHWLTAGFAVVVLLLLFAGDRWIPKFPMLLAVTVVAIVVSWAFDLQGHGVRVVGSIPSGLPLPSWPSIGLVQVLELAPTAVGIALVVFADAILTARSVGRGHVDADQELLALGGLNIGAGLFGSFPVGGSGSRTAVNVRLGGRTQLVSVWQAVTVAVVLLLLTPALAYLPRATLAAVIVYAAIGLIDVSAWRALAAGARAELLIALATVVGMLTAGLLPALVFAVLLSVLDAVRRSAQPRDAVLGWSPRHGRFVDLQRHPGAHVVPGIVVYRLDDRLFFANSRYFRTRVLEAVDGAPYPVHDFVFDAEGVTHLDTSGAAAIRETVEQLRDRNIGFATARMKSAVSASADQLGLRDVVPSVVRFPTVHAAVLAITGVDVTALAGGAWPTPGTR
jgi:sulfate permease, SulP family